MHSLKSPVCSFLTVLILATASACNLRSPTAASRSTPAGNPTATMSPSPQAGAVPKVGEFTVEQLLESGAGGCGMTLRQPSSNQQRYVFFHGLEKDSARIVVDGELIQLRRTAASGNEFYGQQTSQTFESLDGSIQVDVEVKLGERLGQEVIRVQEGTLQVRQADQQIEIPVTGDAGC
jgi:hypothetical protein